MYRAPLKDLYFVLDEMIGEGTLTACPHFADYSAELAHTILEEAGKFAENVLEPLYRSADLEGAKWSPEGVTTPAGFKSAYAQYAEGGWPSLRASPEFGGQGAPTVLGTAVEELWASSNLAFKLCPMLTQGATEAIDHCASDALKAKFLAKMVSGEWAGTMNLTEPQAGSDLSQVRTRAVPEGAVYRLYGQKIFITYGDHDFTPNIIHMVLGRIEGAPPGTRGISLFIVPKVLVNDDGTLGARNDVQCISIEHKLGIHGSPTCVLAFGQKDGAVGYLLGEANRGLEYMFVMMNAARLSVGLEGYAVAERSFQQAAEWARTRVQGKPAGALPPGTSKESPAPIIHHPDVKRMLLTMKSQVQAMRALALYAASQLDLGKHHPDAAIAAAAQSRGDLLIPIVKAAGTEMGVEVASLGIQVHGGMGYIEETGAAQALRDVRITTIYEGTTGIQANDLVGRKVGRDQGAVLHSLLSDAERELNAMSAANPAVVNARAAALEGVATLRESAAVLLGSMSRGPEQSLAVAVPFLKLCALVLGGWLHAKSAAIAARRLAAGDTDREFLEGKLVTATFYATQILPQTLGIARIVQGGAASVIDAPAALI
jgi:alkylation response protein AidB-like acyl-CoA dehydrogenase